MTISLENFDDRDKERYGLTGSPTQVEKIFPPDINTEKVIREGTPEKLSDDMYSILKEQKFI
jgi:electron transfer flavoprotein beta subunit